MTEHAAAPGLGFRILDTPYPETPTSRRLKTSRSTHQCSQQVQIQQQGSATLPTVDRNPPLTLTSTDSTSCGRSQSWGTCSPNLAGTVSAFCEHGLFRVPWQLLALSVCVCVHACGGTGGQRRTKVRRVGNMLRAYCCENRFILECMQISCFIFTSLSDSESRPLPSRRLLRHKVLELISLLQAQTKHYSQLP